MSQDLIEQLGARGAEGNPSFSSVEPYLQLAWDSTSLGELKQCARKYFFRIVLGLSPKDFNVHFFFGLGFHEALEVLDKQRAQGKPWAEASRSAMRYVLEYTWDRAHGRPWLSTDHNKNRGTLVRSVAWYMDHFGEDDPLETLVLSDGRPAVELSVAMPLALRAETTDEDFLLTGHLDRVVKFAGQVYILDRKTTKSTLSEYYFRQFDPDNQFSTYTALGRMAFSLPLNGLIVDAAQVAVGFTRFERRLVPRTPDQTEEWISELGWWLRQAEAYALARRWPGNDKACSMYGGCPFRKICAMSPASRGAWLKTDYDVVKWNPLEVRGDI